MVSDLVADDTLKDTSSPWWLIVLAPLYLSWRVLLTSRLPISDCDEVYNYWEPLHYLLYGTGMQTWEYAYEFALRTFAYLVPLKIISQVILQPILQTTNKLFWITGAEIASHKVAQFAILRVLLGAVTASCEILWLYALSVKVRSFSKIPLLLTAALLISCTGMNHAAAALLPSGTWIGAWCAAAAAFLFAEHRAFVILCVAATLTTGWPFGAVCVIPMAFHILWKEYTNGTLLRFSLFIAATTLGVQVYVMVIDRYYYGTWTSPTLNIFIYNAGNSNDDLYGVEPVSFYVKNLLLNLNLMALLGVVALPVYLFLAKPIDWNVVSMLLCLPVWFAITVPRPHKEERFLFPIYPVLVFGAVLSVDTVLSRLILPVLTPKPLQEKDNRKRQRVRLALHLLVWIPVTLLSVSRMAALIKYYAAPLHVYGELSAQHERPGRVCTCGEWYRFPSSFFLNAELGFLPSSFKGQLPQPFSSHGSRIESQSVLQPFNDRNQEEAARYVNPESCRWIVDFSDGECLMGVGRRAKVLATVPFLDSERTTILHRTLYIPFLHERAEQTGQVTYRDYVVYVIDD